MIPPVKVDDFDNLHLRIRTLGYPDQGESIMISLMNEDNILYNIFADNYEVKGYQYWLSELPSDIRIDALIWTHPDEDHSCGIDRLMAKFDPEKKASIYLPTSLTKETLRNNRKISALNSFKYLQDNYNHGRKYNWNEISLCQDEDDGIRFIGGRKIINRTNNDSVKFRIGFMLPYSSVVNRRVDRKIMNSGEMNDLSLFFIIELNKVRYIFAGDLSENNLKFLDKDNLSACRFIKIPHHGAKDVQSLADIIQGLPALKPHSVTTVFRTEHPYDETLDRYGKKCDAVFSTGRGAHPFGLVEFDYNIKNLSNYSISLTGNAVKVRP